jgi:hypothetical protein
MIRVSKNCARKSSREVSKLLGGPIPSNAVGYAEHRSCSHDAVIRVYDVGGNVIETHENNGDFKKWQ